MEVLVIGGGGREHAIVHALKKSGKISKLYCLPSNAGISLEAEGINISVNDFQGIVAFLEKNKQIGLTVVAPDNPLVDGLVNLLEEKGFRAFGPRKEAAIIEGSKIFAKELMKNNNIPTAEYESFDDYECALYYIEKAKFPVVIKADGLAFGKGVIICQTKPQAKDALKLIMCDKAFGDNNTKVIIEQFLTGREVSVLAFTDGKSVKLMPSAQDHKRAFDGDKGLNTGGMGAFSRSPYFTKDLEEKTLQQIIIPTIEAMNKMGRTFKGVLYFGLMICDGKPYILEYNARFGDPETQVVLPLLETDLYEIFEAVIDERLEEIDIKWSKDTAVTVVLASKGYPGDYEKGKEITIKEVKDATVYHAGTKMVDGKIVTNGGRVLNVTALGKDIPAAREKAYEAIKSIEFDGMFYRKDIGLK